MFDAGNAWSIYFDDPEGNQIEVHAHSPWYIPQPHAHPFDLSLPNDEIMQLTEAHCREDPDFKRAAEREREMKKKMGQEILPGAMDGEREALGDKEELWPWRDTISR